MDEEESDLFEEEGTVIEREPQVPPPEPSQVLSAQLKISVGDPEKKTAPSGLKLSETFVAYLVESSPKRDVSDDDVTSSWRRYSEFEALRGYLVAAHPPVIVPPLPEKRANFIWQKLTTSDTYDLDFLERRRAGLESFLHRVASHPRLGNDPIVRSFVVKEEGWREEANSLPAKSDSWLRRTNASFRVKNTDIRFDQLKSYANELQTAASNLLKTRAKLAERVYGIYKIHGNYSRVFKDWALNENSPLREVLQKASSEVDILANSIDILTDEEDLIAEQVKEYLYFADSVKALCTRHEALQYDVEWFENQLMTNRAEKKQILTGTTKNFSFSGMKARLLGKDSEEEQENRIEQLDKSFGEMEKEYEKHKGLALEFLDEALKEIDYFKARKTADLREIMTSYAVLQIKLHREGAMIWGRFKSHFDSILELKT